MSTFHVAIDRVASPDRNPQELLTATTYLGTVDQKHVNKVRAIAELADSARFVKEHPHIEGAFCVLRDDGDLDVYVPVDATEYRVYEPDPAPKGGFAEGGIVTNMPAVDSDGPPALVMPVSGGPGANDDMGVYLPRGVSGPAYIAGAVKFGDQTIGGAMDYPSNPPRAVWHTTESPAGADYFFSVAAYLIRVAAEPQVIYCPVTDRIGQFGPLTQSARALKNDGARRTNREGKVNVQVEVLGYASKPWTKGFDPATKPNYRKLLAANRAHGVPDVWPAGKPPATATAAAKGPRSRTVWQSTGGNYAHAHVPGNSHWDPGAIDTTIVPGTPPVVAPATPVKPTTPDKPQAPVARPSYEPFPGAGFFHAGRHSKVITAMGRRLVAEGCGAYRNGPGPNWTAVDRESYRRWQRKLGYTGAAADGIPGKKSWDALRVPNV